MTKQEAIKLLKVVIFMVEEQYATEEIEQALEMAIKALEMHDDDLISRHDILSAKFHQLPYTHITPTDTDAESYKRGWNDALDAVADNTSSVNQVMSKLKKTCNPLLTDNVGGCKEKQSKLESAKTVSEYADRLWKTAYERGKREASTDVGDYTKFLEKIIVDAESVWICEDTPCPEWCNENCNYPSIQVDCLRYLYLVKRCKYGNDQEG